MRNWLVFKVVVALAVGMLVSGCRSGGGMADSPRDTGLSGHLILIGGGLDDDNRPVYERIVQLAREAAGPGGVPRLVIATAASGDEEASAAGKIESIRAYAADAKIDVIRRGTSTEETVALVEAGHAMFFTGGDQKRIVDRYRPGGVDTPEAVAMRRLLDRDGVIAGTSAGDAMMSDPMFLTGRSAEALGIRSPRRQAGEDDDPDEKRPLPPLGPQIGTGMGFLPWAIADSHFFERNRFGRLVAALEASGKRLGIGVGEDAGVEVDLETGELIGLSVADSLLVDAAALGRDGLVRRNVRALVVRQGMRLRLKGLAMPSGASPRAPAGEAERVQVVEPGQNRQLASWRFFLQAQEAGRPVQMLTLDGYQQRAWADGRGWAVVEIGPIAGAGDEPPAAGTR